MQHFYFLSSYRFFFLTHHVRDNREESLINIQFISLSNKLNIITDILHIKGLSTNFSYSTQSFTMPSYRILKNCKTKKSAKHCVQLLSRFTRTQTRGRTGMDVTPLVFETSASTDSAIWAFLSLRCKGK